MSMSGSHSFRGAGEGAAGPPPGGPAARLADVCARRAAVYQALALGFREPTLAYLTALAGGELVEGLREAVVWLGPDAAVYEPALAALARAGAELAQCGPAAALRPARRRARPAVHRARPAGRALLRLAVFRRRCRQAAASERGGGGAPPPPTRPRASRHRRRTRELPDHVTIELEFLYHLCRREEAAWDGDAADEATRLRRALDAFLREQAARFFAAFADAVRRAGVQELTAPSPSPGRPRRGGARRARRRRRLPAG